jgi:hypothetical protein
LATSQNFICIALGVYESVTFFKKIFGFLVSGEHLKRDVTLNGNQLSQPVQKTNSLFLVLLPIIANIRNVANLTQNCTFLFDD